MMYLQFNKRDPRHILYAIISFLIVAFLVFNLQSCKSGTAIRHYKKVASETDLPLTSEKKNALATACVREFPIVPITVTKDSIVTKYVKVVDNVLVNKLKTQIALLKKQTPNIDIDSLYDNLLDSVLNSIQPCQETIHWKTETKTVKDTLGNYFRQLEYNKQVDTANTYKVKYVLSDSKLQVAIHDIDVWKKRFFLLLFVVVGYIGLRVLANKFTLPFKIS